MKWEVSELRECNIGGGVEIRNHPRMEVPSDFFSNNIWGEVLNRQVEPGGGWRWRGGGALIFEQEVYFQLLESVFGGVLFPSVGTSPYLWPGARFSISCKKVKVNPWWRQSGVFYFRTELSDFNQFETRLFAWKWKLGEFVLIFCICSFDCFYLQYLKRSRLTWKCSSMQIYQIMKKSL